MFSVLFTCNHILKMFCKCFANVYAKAFAKMLQNIWETFLQMFYHVEHMLKIEGGCT